MFALLESSRCKSVAQIEGNFTSIELSRLHDYHGNNWSNNELEQIDKEVDEGYTIPSPFGGFSNRDAIDRLQFGTGSPLIYGIKQSKAFCYWYTSVFQFIRLT